MKHAPYMASAELNQLMWLSSVVQIMERILDDATTTDKDWRKYMKTIKSYAGKIIDARPIWMSSKRKK